MNDPRRGFGRSPRTRATRLPGAPPRPSRRRRFGALGVASLVVVLAGGAVAVGVVLWREVSSEDAAATFDPLPAPQRVLDTRSGDGGRDGRPATDGRHPGQTAIEVDVAAQAGLPATTTDVVLRVSASGSDTAGSITVYPCGEDRPDVADLRFLAGQTVNQLVLAALEQGRTCVWADADVHVAIDVAGTFSDTAFESAPATARLLDTHPDGHTADGTLAGIGPLVAETVVEVPVAGRAGLSQAPGTLLVGLEATGQAAGAITIHPCGTARPATWSITYDAGETAVNTAVVDLGSATSICVVATAPADLVIDVRGQFDAGLVDLLPTPARLVDTRPGGQTVDGALAGRGLPSTLATMTVAVAGRGGVPAGAAAVIANVTAFEPHAAGEIAVFPPAADRPGVTNVAHGAGATVTTAAIVPLDSSGRVCVHTTRAVHVIVDVVAWIPGEPAAPTSDGCPRPQLFPTWRIVALYGTGRSATLGVLGEQEPEAAVARLDQIAEPWRAGDRPVLGAFELITTLATADAGREGMYNLPASEEFVQRYLDVARRNGLYLILDLQTGQSDFLTEAKRFERFLREPDVGLALDPEWRTQAPIRPGGGYVGQVDASEVNAVAEWLSGIVAEEGLPEKLLVVHQFQTRMVTNRDQLVEPPGIALTIHMDGLGSRSQKLDTYAKVHAQAPWNNGFKLFFDEDIEMFGAEDVLSGVVQPVPDLITYQ